MELERRHFSTLPSTNGYAKEHLDSFDREKLTFIWADEQTDGKARYGRKWISPPKTNITASFVFFIDEEAKEPLSLTHVLAISIVTVLEKRGIIAKIKWPNDILVDSKKIAGILCETEHLSPYFGVVIGLGLNVNMDEATLQTVGQKATSIAVETGKKASIEEVLEDVIDHFMADLELFFERGFAPFQELFSKLTQAQIK